MDEIISVKLVRSKRKAPTTSQTITNECLKKPKTKSLKRRSYSQPHLESISTVALTHDDLSQQSKNVFSLLYKII